MVVMFKEPNSFCKRHKGNTLVRRCAHLGKYYVSEMRPDDGRVSGFMDYVWDVDPIVIEGHYFRDSEEADKLWAELLNKMAEGIVPDPEK